MELYLDRDIGWLRFNERVLFQAEDERTPLLERVRFLNIFQNNLNEFYMKRVGGLQQKSLRIFRFFQRDCQFQIASKTFAFRFWDCLIASKYF
ncbi:MAG: hypothetical protein IPK68_18815 [Bdellovibrionales bacterium]|nr:hypothetical protein [Bdellovibrionales bacterium]